MIQELDPEDPELKQKQLFILSTLLQREFVETLVPVQAAFVLSTLHFFGPDNNNFVHGWTQEDFTQAMVYIAADLAAELAVFAATVLALLRISPEVHVPSILSALLTRHFASMAVLSWTIWSLVLGYQYAHGGVDMSLQFQWLDCPNGTWTGAFEWEGCEA